MDLCGVEAIGSERFVKGSAAVCMFVVFYLFLLGPVLLLVFLFSFLFFSSRRLDLSERPTEKDFLPRPY